MRVRLILSAAAISVAATLAGCGSDDDSSSPATASGEAVTTSELSKAEFVKQANVACAQAKKDSFAKTGARLEENEDEGLSEEQSIADVLETVYVPIVEEEIAAVRELGAPSGDEKEVEAFLVAQEDAVDEVKELEKADSIEVFGEKFDKASRLLTDYGLDRCAKG